MRGCRHAAWRSTVAPVVAAAHPGGPGRQGHRRTRPGDGGSPRTVRVEMQFSRSVARYLPERPRHRTQQAAPRLTGELDLTSNVPVCPEVMRWILSYARDVEVLAPRSPRAVILCKWLAVLRGSGGRIEPRSAVLRPGQPHPIPPENAVPAAEAPATGPRRGTRSSRPRLGNRNFCPCYDCTLARIGPIL